MPELNFCHQNHTSRFLQPFPGEGSFGRFDARLNVQEGVFEVTVRIKFNFGTAFFGTTGISTSRFRNKYRAQIERYWDGRYWLWIDDRGIRRQIKTTITCVEEPNRMNAHYVVNVHRFHVGRSFVRPNPENTCELYSEAVKSRPKGPLSDLGWRIAFGQSRKTMIKRQTQMDIIGEIAFDQGVDFVQDMSTLRTIVQTYKHWCEVRALVRLEVIGYRMQNEAPALSLRRAQVLTSYLQRKGLANHLLAPINGGVNVKSIAQVRVTPATVQQVMNLPSNFPIAAHEFGHKLGLIDEYLESGIDHTQDPGYSEMIELANEIAVPIPKFASYTTSLMSFGDRVLPFHYIPFVSAIKRMQANWLDRNRTWANIQGNTLINGDANVGIVLSAINDVFPSEQESLGLDVLFS